MSTLDWRKYAPFFTEAEFRCKHTGKCEMDPRFMELLTEVRKAYGLPMAISSGYRDRTHPIEAAKRATGAHAMGVAADIAVQGEDALRLIHVALKLGVPRIGVQQKGAGRFIHLDIGGPGLASPTVWSY